MTAEPRTLHWLGVSYRTILSAADSTGAMTVIDSTAPAGSGPPRHVHDREDEVFVILDGTCEFWLEGETFTRTAGETAFVPRGKEHTFRVVGDGPCRHLIVLTPSGFEGFFEDMAEGQFAIPDDMPAIEQSATRHSMRFTGPPLGD